ncbi:type I-U CRISPR-associated RAMP protein Csb1/Cas7u [Rothia aeria]|uniref:type I-G CRISPR-associated RAMP protein Csb1/Cas7g n=1 Tax=Rothia aeria TaxID=172042 RepID=UPI0028EE299A|nr:type I-U CRISPR-associated RAMP protein Csb1/Cas7u [Rothia aeria]
MSAPEKVDIKFEDLKKACASGGASTLVSVTELKPAAGEHASVAPAKFVEGNKSTFAFETRYIDSEAARVVLIDSKQSQLNRAEAAIMQDIRAEHPVMRKLPRIEVTYENDGKSITYTDLELPHRFADGHIRAGEIDGQAATAHEKYRAVRNSTPADLSALLDTAPAAAVFGGWDSLRKKNQLRLRSALVGEIIGVLADQNLSGEAQLSRRGGARVDPLEMSVRLSAADMEQLVKSQEGELSDKFVSKRREDIKKAKKDTALSGSVLGLGGIPPQLEALGGVACQKIIRSWVLSFATLRQLRFGKNEEANIAARALLAALGLSAIARAEQELYLRANCDLVEAEEPQVTLDERYGNTRPLNHITVETADDLLAQAIDYAQSHHVAHWDGQILTVTGNPVILRGAVAESEDAE